MVTQVEYEQCKYPSANKCVEIEFTNHDGSTLKLELSVADALRLDRDLVNHLRSTNRTQTTNDIDPPIAPSRCHSAAAAHRPRRRAIGQLSTRRPTAPPACTYSSTREVVGIDVIVAN
jgi:hypothetical protein